jgi:hypothetical protein
MTKERTEETVEAIRQTVATMFRDAQTAIPAKSAKKPSLDDYDNGGGEE